MCGREVSGQRGQWARGDAKPSLLSITSASNGVSERKASVIAEEKGRPGAEEQARSHIHTRRTGNGRGVEKRSCKGEEGS
jgi:hypothetical protein